MHPAVLGPAQVESGATNEETKAAGLKAPALRSIPGSCAARG